MKRAIIIISLVTGAATGPGDHHRRRADRARADLIGYP